MAHSDPATNSLSPGVQVLERGWLSSNNIVILGDDHTALVDTGYVVHEAQTLALVRTALQERALDTLVNTHLHSDHCGGNNALQSRYPSVSTLVPEASICIVQPGFGSWTRLSVPLPATMGRRDNAAHFCAQGGATHPGGLAYPGMDELSPMLPRTPVPAWRLSKRTVRATRGTVQKCCSNSGSWNFSTCPWTTLSGGPVRQAWCWQQLAVTSPVRQP